MTVYVFAGPNLEENGKRAFISGELWPNCEENKEQRPYWGTGNIGKQIFDFRGTGEHTNLFNRNKGRGPPSGRASLSLISIHLV